MPNDNNAQAAGALAPAPAPAAAPPAPQQGIRLQPVRDDSEFAVLLDSDRFAQIQRVAKLFSESTLVPDVFQGKPANCAVALQMAFRMQVDPMMLMQNMYIVHGRPGIEAKLAIALMNSRGPFTGPLQWIQEGEAGTRQWTCYATHEKTGERCSATVTWAMVVAEGWDAKSGSKWKTLPDLMGRYRSAMFLGRLYCPEVLLGLPTSDELIDVGARNERVIGAGRVVDESPIDLPTERAAAPANDKQPIDVDTTTGEVKNGNATPAAAAASTPAPTAAAPAQEAKGKLSPASEAQRAMVVTVAKQAGVAEDAIDGMLVDKFAFVLADMPAQLFNDVLQFFKKK